MANIFNSISLKKPVRTTFDKSFREKYTTNLGLLYPIFFEEVVPSSRVKLNTNHFVRFQPMLAPVFDSVHYKQYYFFVPYRLLCKNSPNAWDNFRTGGELQDFGDMDVYGVPYLFNKISLDDEQKKFLQSFELPNTLIEYLSQNDLNNSLNALSIAAYWRIITDYFCDEQLDYRFIERFDYWLTIGGDISELNLDDLDYFRFFRKRYKKDYFTSATVNPQLGDPVNLPLNTGLSLSADDNLFFDVLTYDSQTSSSTGGNIQTANGQLFTEGLGVTRLFGNVFLSTEQNPNYPSSVSPLDLESLLEHINIENNTLFSVRDLRNSFIMQEMLERNNVAGYRYFEWIKAHFGINSPDARLQRSEFLGSSDDIINFIEVEQTTPDSSEDDTPLGYLAGKGVGSGSNAIFDRTFSEDGIIIGLGCYVPDNNYYQGVPKRFLRKSGLDYLIPIFERVGEQAIQNQELVYNGNSRDIETFGYTSRYADYKSHVNIQKGDFNSNLKYWTFSRDLVGFGLSSDFLQINYEDFDDCFAVQDTSDKILCVQNFLLEHTLPISRYSTPAKI